jgi:uncharacterized RDD family membrane protein YckC
MIQPRPAGFWIRALAAGLDFVVFAFVQATLLLIGRRILGADLDGATTVRPLAAFCTLLFAGVYATVLHSLAGQTIGKMIVGVRVVAGEAGPPPFGAALLRFAGYFASAAIFALGFVVAGLRGDKRALHDLIAGTRVEHVAGPEGSAVPPAETSEPAVSRVV